jgi:hypothetical protein
MQLATRRTDAAGGERRAAARACRANRASVTSTVILQVRLFVGGVKILVRAKRLHCRRLIRQLKDFRRLAGEFVKFFGEESAVRRARRRSPESKRIC